MIYCSESVNKIDLILTMTIIDKLECVCRRLLDVVGNSRISCNSCIKCDHIFPEKLMKECWITLVISVFCFFCYLWVSGCPWMWDNLTCWHPAQIGEVVEVNCPEIFTQVMSEEEYGQWWCCCTMHQPVLTLIDVSLCVHCEKHAHGGWTQPGFQDYFNSFISSHRYRMWNGLWCGFSVDYK